MQVRSGQAERLLAGVETSLGSGEFRVDERLRVEEVRQRGDQAISTARIAVLIDDDFDSEEARRRYRPDLRLVIMTDEPDASRRRMLFEGYPPAQTARWDGRFGQEEESYVFEAEHVFERLSCDREGMIYGRRMRNGAIEDGLVGDPAAFAGQSALMTALPCVFNPDGVPNRAEAPLMVQAAGGVERPIHLFTWDDPRAIKWTYATVLRYLIWFYLPRYGPVLEGNVFAATEDLAAGRRTAVDPLTAALAQEPVSLVCEATSLAEALSLWATAAGVHAWAETANVNGRPVTSLRVWSAQAGPPRCLYLARGGRHADGAARYDTAARSAGQILTDNNVYRGEATWDHRGIVNAPVVIGDVKRYEMTLPLRPGWTPRANIDNVAPADRVTAKGLAMTPEQVEAAGADAESVHWFRHYHRRGSVFGLDGDVSRLWVLNEDGYYDPAAYNRNPPFDDYRPFDFSMVADEVVTRRGGWTRRPRRLMPVISTSADGRKLGVWVEISFDAGATWQLQSSGVRVLEDRAGVYFECDNPTEITPVGADPGVQNLWFALIDQTFRVRVTAVVESDERLIGTYPPGRLAAPTQHINGMVVAAAKSFKFASREHTQDVLRGLLPVGDGRRDDSAAIAAYARQLALAGQDRRVSVLPAIPWIETCYGLGDRISEIRGRQLRFATATGSQTRYPAVLERCFMLRDGCYETRLVLGVTPAPART